MNKDCAIARDLMPPVIDGVASGESRDFVQEHTAACEPCAQVYRDMQSEIQAVEDETAEDTAVSFKAAMAQLRKTMGWRRIKTALLTVILTFVLIIVGYCGHYYLFKYNNGRVMPMDAYTISVYQGSDGTAYGATHFLKDYAANGPMITSDDDCKTLYIWWNTTIVEKELTHVPHPNPQYGIHMTMTADGNLTLYGETVIQEIRQGTPDDYTVVYRAGDVIPPLDPSVDAYFQTQKSYFDQINEAQRMWEDAQQTRTDAQDEFNESPDQQENGETAAP